MNQQLKDFGQQKKIPASVLKWIWENKETLLAIIKLLFPKDRVSAMSEGCDKNNPKDPHYGDAGEYDSECNWIPWT